MSDVPYPKAVERFPTLRQSRLATFDDCALLAGFDLKYREGWSDHDQASGQIFHRFAAKALLEMVDRNETKLPTDVALAILRETLRQHDVPDEDVVSIPMSKVKDLRWMVVKWSHDNTFTIKNLVAVEKRLEAPVYYDNPAGGFVERRLTGQLDALFVEGADHAILLDWKSGWGLPPEKGISEGGYFQQRFYAFLLMKTYPSIQRVTLREFYVRFSDTREATMARDKLPEVEEELAALAERFDRTYEIGGALWKPSPGKHCSYCPLPHKCPIFPDVRRSGAIQDWDDAKRVAAELIVAKSAVKARDGAAKAWARAHGPIPIKAAKDPNRVLGFKETTRVERPDQDKMQQAVAQGIDPRTLYRESTSTRFVEFTREEVPEVPEDAALMNALEESIERGKEAA